MLCIKYTCDISLWHAELLSHVRVFEIPWTLAHPAPLFMGFPSQEYWSVLPFPSPGDLPNPEMEPMFAALAGEFFTAEQPGNYIGKPLDCQLFVNIIIIGITLTKGDGHVNYTSKK